LITRAVVAVVGVVAGESVVVVVGGGGVGVGVVGGESDVVVVGIVSRDVVCILLFCGFLLQFSLRMCIRKASSSFSSITSFCFLTIECCLLRFFGFLFKL
jgi:hypothetical protein